MRSADYSVVSMLQPPFIYALFCTCVWGAGVVSCHTLGSQRTTFRSSPVLLPHVTFLSQLSPSCQPYILAVVVVEKALVTQSMLALHSQGSSCGSLLSPENRYACPAFNVTLILKIALWTYKGIHCCHGKRIFSPMGFSSTFNVQFRYKTWHKIAGLQMGIQLTGKVSLEVV